MDLCWSFTWPPCLPVHLWMTQSKRTLSWQPYLFVIKYLRSESFQVVSGRTAPTGSSQTSPSCSNNTGRLCYALSWFYQIPPGCWLQVGRQLPFTMAGFSCENANHSHQTIRVGGAVLGEWLGLWSGHEYSHVPFCSHFAGICIPRGPGGVVGAEGSGNSRGRRNISGAVGRHWRASPSQWPQQLPWKTLRRLLKASGSSPCNVLPLLTSHYRPHKWVFILKLSLLQLMRHEPCCFCSFYPE